MIKEKEVLCMSNNLTVVSEKRKGKVQEIQSLSVIRINNEFQFNFSTALDPRPEEIEFLRDFRNDFVDKLDQLNIILGLIPK